MGHYSFLNILKSFGNKIVHIPVIASIVSVAKVTSQTQINNDLKSVGSEV